MLWELTLYFQTVRDRKEVGKIIWEILWTDERLQTTGSFYTMSSQTSYNRSYLSLLPKKADI